MLFVVIQGVKSEEIAQKINAVDRRADGIEIRLDRLQEISFPDVRGWLKQASVPVMLTLRSKAHGGFCSVSEEERELLIQKCAALEPAFLDVEYDMNPHFLQHLQLSLHTKLICSYHNFSTTPLNLDDVLRQMEACPAYIYKLATMAHSICDALRMLSFVRTHMRQGKKITGICMGEPGEVTRILGPIVGNQIDYAAFDASEGAAISQLSVATLCDTYRYKTLNPSSHIYGLIGDPITLSPSHDIHNKTFSQLGINGVYIKMRVREEELGCFFSHIHSLPFWGLSVTMPLKEAILPYLKEIHAEAKKIGAVNTLVFEEGVFAGYNTDGQGALDILETHTPVKDKTILILGAGGAARAIAFESAKRKARVIIANRTATKAQALAARMAGHGISLEELPTAYAEGYDILINTTPLAEDMPIEEKWIIPGCIAMDILSMPKMTRFLQTCEKKGCTLLFGIDMFHAQARGQFHLWFPNVS